MKRVWALTLTFSSACIVGGQGSCWRFTEPTTLPAPFQPIATPTPTPTPTPAPTPTPSPTPVPVSCAPDWLKIDGPAVLLQREKGTYWLTPMQNYVENGEPKSRQVPDACNVPKASSVRWSFQNQFDGIYATQVPDGFSTLVTRVGAGVSITLRVEFEGLFTTKVIQ